MGAVTLILGGTKTGKTTFAQSSAQAIQDANPGSQVLYIATARVLDGEMELRVKRHRADRPAEWKTWERDRDLHEGLQEESSGCSAVILDCLTMLMTNIVLDQGEEFDREAVQPVVEQEIGALIRACSKIDGEVFIISNQVETGLVSPTILGRLFQDLSGILHQYIARHAEHVYLMTAGIPQKIK